MAPLTWRNVDAPNFSGVTDAYRVVGSLLKNATDSMNKGIEGFQEGRTQSASAQLMNDIMKNRNPAELEKAMAAGILGSNDPRYISPEALKFAAGYGDQLNQNELARQRLALASSTALNGRGRGQGRGGADDFVDVNGASGIRGYVNNEGNITTTPVGTSIPTTEDMPIQKVSQLPTDIVSDVVAAADPTSTSFSSESTVGAPAVSVSNTMPVAAFNNDPIQDIVNSVRPVAGPIRIGTPRGKDGLNQRNSELTADLVNGRLASFGGTPEEAIAAWGQNPRLLGNATATNALVGIENEISTAKAGQGFRKGQFEERKMTREEEDELRSRDYTDQARELANAAVLANTDAASAKASIDYTGVPPEVAVRVNGILDSYAKDGLFTDFSARTADPAPVVADAKDTKKADAAVDPAVTPLVPSVDPAANTPIAGRVANVLDQFAFDRSGDRNAAIMTSFREAANDDTSPAVIANRATGKGGAFEGMDKDEYISYLTQAMEDGKIKASMAAVALENSVQNPGTLADWNPFSSRINSDRVAEITGMFRDSQTGAASPRFLQERARYSGSKEAEKLIRETAKEAEKTQAALDRATRIKETTRPGLDLSEPTKRAVEARTKAEEALAKATAPGGAAYAYRGNFPPAATAEALPDVTPRQQAVSAEAKISDVYIQLMQQKFGDRVPSKKEAVVLRKQAEEIVNSQQLQRYLDTAAR